MSLGAPVGDPWSETWEFRERLERTDAPDTQGTPRFKGHNVRMPAEPTEEVRVLVVDDEPNIVDVISMALRHDGFTVHSASSGAEAIKAVSSFHPHLMVLDIMLGDMEGFDVAKRLSSERRMCRSCSLRRAMRPRTRSAA